MDKDMNMDNGAVLFGPPCGGHCSISGEMEEKSITSGEAFVQDVLLKYSEAGGILGSSEPIRLVLCFTFVVSL